MYSIQQIASFIECRPEIYNSSANIEYLLIDSRRLVFPTTTLFFALQTDRNNGADFIEELYLKGVRNFVVHQSFSANYTNVNLLYVEDTLVALQQLAATHRQQFAIPVIGITGSNGKTMVKEWLNKLLQPKYNIVRSPKSYNSQVGVPLSVWQINASNTLGIFEAGISRPGEMERLVQIIKPTIGILTNIGDAHNEGFKNTAEKLSEKLKLFTNVKTFVYCKDCIAPLGADSIDLAQLTIGNLNMFSWSTLTHADLIINETRSDKGFTKIAGILTKTGKQIQITIPFTDKASLDNAITCWCVMQVLGIEQEEIEQRMLELEPLDMRMQLKKGVNNCQLINDSYSNDLSSLELALDYLSQQANGKKTTLILSDIFQSGIAITKLCNLVIKKIKNRHVNQLMLIGPVFFSHKETFLKAGDDNEFLKISFYSSTNAFLNECNTHHFNNEVILLKGARVFEFERIVHWLEEKVHQTVLEVNLDAMVNNLKQIQNLLKPATRLMAMVKAFSYGSGSAEVAALLQFHKVDYLAVAYADEGVELRKAGISLPIMVMSPEVVTFDALVEYNLEPELYSFNIFNAFCAYLTQQGIPQYPVHIKLDTGMHRLGFELSDLPGLEVLIQNNKQVVIKSVFSHLASSENPAHDEYTLQQAADFDEACSRLKNVLGYSFIRHLSNTAAISRHPQLHYDMVRLGIGLYGIQSSSSPQLQLQTVITLKSTIAQVRTVKAGDRIGYGRKGNVLTESIIATVRIGYADGFSRALGNGAGHIFVNGKLAPVIGSVCMDMTMIDITGISGVNEGDVVEIFGENLPATQLAQWAQTIPYEILTSISQRVKRVYYH